MEEILTQSNITFIIGLFGIVFTIYSSIRSPQARGEKFDAVIDAKMKLIQESNDRRFEDTYKRIEESTTLSRNCIHTVEIKVDELASKINQSNSELVKLSTIIEERIPSRK